MTTIKLFISTKNTDLAAMSAEETLKHTMNIGDLVGLRRFNGFELYCGGTSNAQSVVEKILASTYYLANPNKESVSIDRPASRLPKNVAAVWVVVTPKSGGENPELLKKISTRFPGAIQQLHQFVAWELLFPKSATTNPQFLSTVEQKIVVTKNHNQGLLVNPLYETFTLTLDTF